MFRTAGSQRTRSPGESVASTTASACGARRDAPCAASSMRVHGPRAHAPYRPAARHAQARRSHVHLAPRRHDVPQVRRPLRDSRDQLPQGAEEVEGSLEHGDACAGHGVGGRQEGEARRAPPTPGEGGRGACAQGPSVPLSPRPGSLAHPRRRPTPAPQRLSRRWRRPASRFPQRSVCPRHAGASWVRVFERRRWPGVGCGGVRVFHVCTRFCVLERRPPYFASHVQPTIHTHTHTPHTTDYTHIRVTWRASLPSRESRRPPGESTAVELRGEERELRESINPTATRTLDIQRSSLR